MRVHDLGALVVEVDGRLVELGTTKQAALLARLLVSLGSPVPSSALISAAWGLDARVSAASLDNQVWRLRNVLQPGRDRASSILTRTRGGYRLTVPPDQVDSARFLRLTTEVDSRLDQATSGPEVLRLIDEALGLWRGRPYEPVDAVDDVVPAVSRLVELHDQLCERRIGMLLDAGQVERALADLEPLLARVPFRERLWAHRMRALAGLGRTEEALATYRRVRDLLADELGLDPGAELQELHAQLLSGELAPTTPTRPVPAGATTPIENGPRADQPPELHLPRRATPLLGRARDLERIQALVSDHALVTLTGAGGSGKTRLAVEAAATVTRGFGDGVWFVDLTATADEALVPVIVTSALGLAATGVDDPLVVLERYFADRFALLVMDNCEHVLAGAARCVEAVLGAGGRSAVLATSREPLAVDGEIVWSLSPLSLVEPRAGLEGQGSLSAAVQLFVDRAQAASPELDLGLQELATVERVCRAVDGLPLAIELAAARVRTYTLDEIAEQVASDPTRLARLGRRRDDHRSTVYDTIEWSYRLLDEEARALHRQLSVLPGEFPLSAAQGVSTSRDDVATVLATLVHGSMLVARRRAGRATTFAQLDTVRAHARRRLREMGEEGAALARRDGWVRDLLQRRPLTGSVGEPAWYDELDDAYTVVRECLHDQVRREGDASLVRLGSDLAFYWYYRGRVVEGARWLEAAQESGPPPRSAVDAGIRAVRLAAVHFLRTRRDLGEPSLRAGLHHLVDVAEADLVAVVDALVGCASAAWACEAYDLVAELHGRAEPLSARARDPELDGLVEMIGCISRLPTVPLETSKAEAAALFERGATLSNPFVQWMAALLRTGVATMEHDPEDGVRWIKRLVPIHLRFGTSGGSVFLESLANYAAMAGHFTEAARLYGGAVNLARQAGSAWPNRPQTPSLEQLAMTTLGGERFAREAEIGSSLTLAQVASSWSPP